MRNLLRSATCACLVIAIAFAGTAAAEDVAVVTATQGSRFSPTAVPSLGALKVAAGESVTFNTGYGSPERSAQGILKHDDKIQAAIKMRPAASLPQVSGVVKGAGGLGRSASGKVEVALFAFDSIDIEAGAEVNVEGARALVLLSRGDIIIDSTIDLSGDVGAKKGAQTEHLMPSFKELQKSGAIPTEPEGGAWKMDKEQRKMVWFAQAWFFVARGGPGADGGVRGKSVLSNPPPSHPLGGGMGSAPAKDNGFAGAGYGAGFNRRAKGGAAGGGAAYGGAGGASSKASRCLGQKVGEPMPGGVVYGDEKLTDLFGGSGGAGGSNDRQKESAGGGGGGGALALIASGKIVLKQQAKLLVHGGAGGTWEICGGGGSGGAVLLAAQHIVLDDAAVINASGGAGGKTEGVQAAIDTGHTRINKGNGGGGGGGRVAFYSQDAFPQAPAAVKVAGGAVGEAATPGAEGTFYAGH